MSQGATEQDVRSLQRRAEHAIRAAKPREYILKLLEQLVAAASAESEAARFAHRHLAELRLEESPWKAALHLRRVLTHDADDDIAHALMGLCHALQANFKSAVAAYRRAVALAPSNPWYNHNLGHLLDVALGASKDALPYLRRAYKLEPGQDEVAASLAHCLGRVGGRAEALSIAKGLTRRNPREANHRALLRWLEEGATAARDSTVPGLLSAISPAAAAARTGESPAVRGATVRSSQGEGTASTVERLIDESLARCGREGNPVERGRTLWRDYARIAGSSGGRPEALAAAVDYALAKVDGAAVKQKDVAEKHGVSVSALQARYAAIRESLALQPHDSRYAHAPRRERDDERSRE